MKKVGEVCRMPPLSRELIDHFNNDEYDYVLRVVFLFTWIFFIFF